MQGHQEPPVISQSLCHAASQRGTTTDLHLLQYTVLHVMIWVYATHCWRVFLHIMLIMTILETVLLLLMSDCLHSMERRDGPEGWSSRPSTAAPLTSCYKLCPTNGSTAPLHHLHVSSGHISEGWWRMGWRQSSRWLLVKRWEMLRHAMSPMAWWLFIYYCLLSSCWSH